MDRKLKRELDQALQDIGNAAVPLPTNRVRELIVGLRELQQGIVEWRHKNDPRR